MPRSKPVPGADPDRWRAIAVCLLAGFMTLLDVSVVNVALPSVQAGLRTSSAQLSWVVAGYTLAFGLALVPSGRLGDGLGRRRMFLVGLAAFTVLSMVCGVSVSGTWLVCARRAPMWLVLCGPLLVAGLGSGLVIGPNLTLALQRVPPAQGGTAAAVLQTAQRIGSAFGLAVVGSAFLGTLAASHGDSSLAVRRGVFTSAALVGVALLAAVADALGSTRGRRPVDS
ncbi:hypothetical protein GCM10023195_27740 [Actinoallomurus liliacearum]|uniref:Major facilitator superfamily (MFS) profile domain-containing protein n=1 Tax=Actinoallomurus liliacearum TaxID=1080073 RepID=A0ABP8TFZ5_9ACTN